MSLRLALGTTALAFVLAAPAGADYFTYTTDSGTLAYTDELKRVPARYRGRVTRHKEQPFWSYARVTEVPAGASYAPSQPPIEETQPEAAPVAQPPAAQRTITVTAGAVQYELPYDSEAPVSVTPRVVFKNGVSMKQYVVERDGQTVALIDHDGEIQSFE